jgi:hypothetical protein
MIELMKTRQKHKEVIVYVIGRGALHFLNFETKKRRTSTGINKSILLLHSAMEVVRTQKQIKSSVPQYLALIS